MQDSTIEKQASNLLNKRFLSIVKQINANLSNTNLIKEFCEKKLEDLTKLRKDVNNNLNILKEFNIEEIKDSDKYQKLLQKNFNEQNINFSVVSINKAEVYENYFDSIENFFFENNEENLNLLQLKVEAFNKFVEKSKSIDIQVQINFIDYLKTIQEKKKIIKMQIKNFIDISNIFEREERNNRYMNLLGFLNHEKNNKLSKRIEIENSINQIQQFLNEISKLKTFFSELILKWSSFNLYKINIFLLHEFYTIPDEEPILKMSKIPININQITADLYQVFDYTNDLFHIVKTFDCDLLHYLDIINNKISNIENLIKKNYINEKEKNLLIDLYLLDAEQEFIGLKDVEYEKYKEKLNSEILLKQKRQREKDISLKDIEKRIYSEKVLFDGKKIEKVFFMFKKIYYQRMKENTCTLVNEIRDFSDEINDNRAELVNFINEQKSSKLFKLLKIQYDDLQEKIKVENPDFFNMQ